jgi:hypothetical protein
MLQDIDRSMKLPRTKIDRIEQGMKKNKKKERCRPPTTDTASLPKRPLL